MSVVETLNLVSPPVIPPSNNDIERFRIIIENSFLEKPQSSWSMPMYEFMLYLIEYTTPNMALGIEFFDEWIIYQNNIFKMLNYGKDIEGKIAQREYENCRYVLTSRLQQNLVTNLKRPQTLCKKRLSERSYVFQTIYNDAICKMIPPVFQQINSDEEMNCSLLDFFNEFFIQFILYYDNEVNVVPRPFHISYMKMNVEELENKKSDEIYITYMEKVKGLEFSKFLVKEKVNQNFPREKNLLFFVEDICIYLNALHEKYCFIHGDLKPDNIMILLDGSINFIDFGFSSMQFKGSRIFVDFADIHLEKDLINKEEDYDFDYLKFLKTKYGFQSDIIYLFSMMSYYLDEDHELMKWITETFFMLNGVNMINVLKETGNQYVFFIISKEPEALQPLFPELNIPNFINRFSFQNISDEIAIFRNKLDETAKNN